jgi:hypothetical protein
VGFFGFCWRQLPRGKFGSEGLGKALTHSFLDSLGDGIDMLFGNTLKEIEGDCSLAVCYPRLHLFYKCIPTINLAWRSFIPAKGFHDTK